MASTSPSQGSEGHLGSPENANQVSDLPSNGALLVEAVSHVKAEPKASAKSSSKQNSGSSITPSVPTFPPPKTDKPRPHVCTTCMRSFARLEHLKRHERSHTKEKPFECPSCTRCFARRDLLLRHQQKLHSTTTPSSRPRNARRESTAGVANGRVRKNSVASTITTPMRPRANTVSHIDASAMGATQNMPFGRLFNGVHNHHNSFSSLTTMPNFGVRGIVGNGHAAAAGLTRLETAGLSSDLSSGLRTAPPFGGFGTEFSLGTSGFDFGNGSTINPHALHMHNMQNFAMDGSFDHPIHSAIPNSQNMLEDEGYDWMTQGFDGQMAFAHINENAIDDSSPSMMSTNSPVGYNDQANMVMNGVFVENNPNIMNSGWQGSVMTNAHVVNSPMSMDVQSFFGDMAPAATDTISPKSLMAQKPSAFDISFPTPPDLSTVDPAAMAAMAGATFTLPFKNEHVASTASSASMDSTHRQSSVTTTSSDLVNDHMRNILIAGLSQNAGFGQRKPSQPTISSPLSPNISTKSKSFNIAAFPSTQDLQRYVSAYIKYFHPHLPFLHIGTLNFESSEYSQVARAAKGYTTFTSNSIGGGSCLMLSMAAMGALYEDELTHSRELFECAKRLISTYLEDRRRNNMGKGSFAPFQRSEREDTPLWLVQAMLLNVIYGHNIGDKTAADVASNHCAALVSLARGAELAKPYHNYTTSDMPSTTMHPHTMHNHSISADGWNMLNIDTSETDWYEWKVTEERKRTLYAIFILSSLLVTAYNRAPALTNSEIRLDLPCDEELWAADSAPAWRTLGGVAKSEARSVQFATALTYLLTASQRQRRATTQHQAGEPWMTDDNDLQPSSFGCLILINALHNYIWETRQRHLGRQWTTQDIEQMHTHIEPALRSWQAAWRSNPMHAIERPNPFGAGPLSADSIPLLDLAYVRLFVDFGRAKEAYWQRDYDAMAQELAKDSDSGSHARSQPQNGLHSPPFENDSKTAGLSEVEQNENQGHGNQVGDFESGLIHSVPTPRERHLRKAGFYAADHLLASNRLGTGLDEENARELPMQSILCACDCAHVLAEWTATIQERVGKYVGILGRDEINLLQVPSVVLLDDEDRKLLGMIDELLGNMEGKGQQGSGAVGSRTGGYGSRVLAVTSQLMAQTAIWPVTKIMARSISTLAGHIEARELGSVPSMCTV